MRTISTKINFYSVVKNAFSDLKIMYGYTFVLILTLLMSCQHKNTDHDINQWKSEIQLVEQAFNKMVQEEGISSAFSFFIADDGVLMRNNKIVKGKAAVSEYLKKFSDPNASLKWSPTFIDVSRSGDLAYTYGDFLYSTVDSLGNKKELKGIFHTVWKKQKDGSWKFVWD